MKIIFQIGIFLWIALSVVCGLLSALKAEREDLSFRQVFLWLVSPFTFFAGVIFIDRHRQRYYFQRMKRDLLIKNK